MGIGEALVQNKLKWIEFIWFYKVLGLSLQDTAYHPLDVLIELIDYGLELKANAPGSLGYDHTVHSNDVKMCLIRMKKGKLVKRGDNWVDVNKGMSDAYLLPIINLYVSQQNIKQVYQTLGESQYPWPIVPWADEDNHWRWFSTNEDNLMRLLGPDHQAPPPEEEQRQSEPQENNHEAPLPDEEAAQLSNQAVPTALSDDSTNYSPRSALYTLANEIVTDYYKKNKKPPRVLTVIELMPKYDDWDTFIRYDSHNEIIHWNNDNGEPNKTKLTSFRNGMTPIFNQFRKK